MGIQCLEVGFLQDALDYLAEALELAREENDRAREANVLNSLGSAYLHLGGFEEAERYLLDALKSFGEINNRRGQAAALHNAVELYRHLGRIPEALDRSLLAQAIAVELGDDSLLGSISNGLGAIKSDLGMFEDALQAHRDAVSRDHAAGNRRGEAIALANAGNVLAHDLDRPQDALDDLEPALGIARELGDRDAEAFVLQSMAEAHRRLGDSDESLDCLRGAIRIVESLRGEIVGEELRASYFAVAGDLYPTYVSRLVDRGQDRNSLRAAERGKARAFLDLLTEVEAGVRTGVDTGLLEEEQRLFAERRSLRARRIRLASSHESGGDADELLDLTRREQELELAYQRNQRQIRRRNPRYADLRKPKIWGLVRIQNALLDPQTALLEYVLGAERSFLFVVLKDGFEIFELPPKRRLEAEVRELRAAVVARLHRYPHGHELYRWLIEPAADLIRGKELLICPDGALHYLPFSLLLTRPPDDVSEPPAHEEGTVEERELGRALIARLAPLPRFEWGGLPYLVREHSIRYAPSATVAGILHQEAPAGERHYDTEFAAFADPTIGGPSSIELKVALAHTGASLAPLPMTAVEAWALAELVAADGLSERRPSPVDEGTVAVYTGATATKGEVQKLTSGRRSFRFLHVASHGLLDPEKPQFSGLVFTPENGQDPFWRTFEIFNARIPSELVVLSACETGLGRIVSGEGIVGLTRAFLYAGAETVCVSLWRVADASTPPLMEAFYKRLLQGGESRARSLQQAQLRFLEKELMRDFYARRLSGEPHELRGTELPAPEDERYRHPFYWAPFVLVGAAG